MNADEFREQYLKTHPASIPQPPGEQAGDSRLMRWGVFAMFIAASLISGAHTVPTIYASIEPGVDPIVRQGIALSGFVAVELAIFLASYDRKRGNHSAVVRWTLGVVFTIALVANVTSTAKAFNAGADVWALIVALVLGVGIPLVALLAGEMVAHGQNTRHGANAAAWRAYRGELQALDAKINAAFQKHEQKTLPAPDAVHEPFTKFREMPREKQPRVKIHEIVARVRENGDEGLSTDQMMERYQISAGSTSKVRQMLNSTNGNGKHE